MSQEGVDGDGGRWMNVWKERDRRTAGDRDRQTGRVDLWSSLLLSVWSNKGQAYVCGPACLLVTVVTTECLNVMIWVFIHDFCLSVHPFFTCVPLWPTVYIWHRTWLCI